MKTFLKLVRVGASLFGVSAVIYLANEGELGVNMTTVKSTSSPIVIIIITYVFDLLKYVLPTTIVKLFISKATSTLGTENVKFLMDLINNITPEQAKSYANELVSLLKENNETLALIRKDQVDNG